MRARARGASAVTSFRALSKSISTTSSYRLTRLQSVYNCIYLIPPTTGTRYTLMTRLDMINRTDTTTQ